ncbi:similar to Saccharomyces cerevisiae YGR282C BGL2 Endo-beta-1,3-glucanase, major protein of the cell wall, involved in cell wall maintenance [Maudiozyma saulgeensis]|uniref:glucan 1,3-beta-glucosidase n=1 Tax=Maudiozyma saulgeensis TaxID=1789683 RepID=A0A1X7RAC5_9SACH|nr:similar to Saccharomyces cerevisiae YGR282C BGL2 Endo-beta-1,3-glucanase, major protein of the cell wall, involved in cell wall maintenance [Kazachstania saulgeensis]
MRFSTLASITTLLASASKVAALGELAFNIGVKNNDGTCKSTSDYETELQVLKSYTSTIKVYAASDCNTLQNLGPAAEAEGFSVFVGVWPNDDAHFQAEQDALTAYLPKIKTDTVAGFLVGSEALYRDDLTASQLADKINTIRTLIGGISDSEGQSYSGKQVGTVDSWNVLVAGYNSAVIEASDFVMANAFSYWQGQTMNNASYSFFDDIMQALQTIQTTKGSTDITFWVGETGWPTDGTNFESAYPSVDNAKQFWKEGICAMRAWGVNVIVFEAFDEDWKPNTSGTSDVEKHWGVWTSSNTLKYSLDCDFSN